MAERAARTAWGPIVQVAIEQAVPAERRIITDEIAFQLLPTPLKMLVGFFKIDAIRTRLLNVFERKAPGIRAGILCRKRYIDDRLIDSLGKGIRSVAILGSGFDTRAYRIPELQSMVVYEVDLPEVVNAKKNAVKKLFGNIPSHVRYVAVNFNKKELDEALQENGYSFNEPSFYIWEGVTQYIHETAVGQVLSFLMKAKQGSRLVFTYIRKDFIEGKTLYGLDSLYKRVRLQNQLWQFGIEPERVGSLLEEYSWQKADDVGSTDYQNLYIVPTNRAMPVMQIERLAYAVKI